MLSLDELQKRYGIGLTGGIACGKSTVSAILTNYGYTVIDADSLARKAVEQGSRGLAQIVNAFGGVVLHEDGSLNRRYMRDLIFQDEKKRRKLESITHPIIQDLLQKDLASLDLLQAPRIWFFEASLLIETGSYERYRAVWLVNCPLQLQLQRIQKRDKISLEAAERIVASQLSTKAKIAKADLIIDTSSPLVELEAKVKHALQETMGAKF